MAKPNAPEETNPPYPTFKDLRDAEKWVRPGFNSADRLFWALDGSLTSAISVLPHRAPYYEQTISIRHPISKLPVTEPKVSSITVRVYELGQWDECWCDQHWPPAEPGEEGVEWATMPTDEDECVLLMCCGEARPFDKNASLVVKPMAASDEGFVTVHDYVSAVHPWLMSLKGDILAAMGEMDGKQAPLAEETKLLVRLIAIERLRISLEKDWRA